MRTELDALFTPGEFAALRDRDLSRTACVVFDLFRATSTIVTALANGAAAVIPVAEISDALAIHQRRPEVLLAGERNGLRIRGQLSGGVDFDLGNSPREFTRERVKGRTIVLSTTNGSRALRACAHAKGVFVGSFLNLGATAEWLRRNPVERVLLVCSGTAEDTAYEDILGAGALAELMVSELSRESISDSANFALQIYRQHATNPISALENSRNGQRLLLMPELRDDVTICLQRDTCPLVAQLRGESIVKIA